MPRLKVAAPSPRHRQVSRRKQSCALRQRAKAHSDTRAIWDTLSADIKRHEETHVKTAKNHAWELEVVLEA